MSESIWEKRLALYKKWAEEDSDPDRKESYIWLVSLLEAFPISCRDVAVGISCPKGWRNEVWNAIEKIEAIANETGTKPQIVQIKEKFGGLRLYVYGDNEEGIRQIVKQAENNCYHICEACGKDGRIRQDIPWYSTLCDEHYLEVKKDDPMWRSQQNE